MILTTTAAMHQPLPFGKSWGGMRTADVNYGRIAGGSEG